MGFDVYGRDPILTCPKPEAENYQDMTDDEKHDWHMKVLVPWQNENPGEYFRASMWSWRPLWDIMSKTCDGILDKETMDALCFNDGAGPEDQETCTEMAEAIEGWLEESDWMGQSEYSLASNCRVKKETGEFVSMSELDNERVWQETRSAYGIEISHILEFCRFLRKCGGFQAW